MLQGFASLRPKLKQHECQKIHIGPRILPFQVDIVVGTPGRMEDVISTGKLVLSATRFFVLDEAVSSIYACVKTRVEYPENYVQRNIGLYHLSICLCAILFLLIGFDICQVQLLYLRWWLQSEFKSKVKVWIVPNQQSSPMPKASKFSDLPSETSEVSDPCGMQEFRGQGSYKVLVTKLQRHTSVFHCLLMEMEISQV